jgi:hypothetical protein
VLTERRAAKMIRVKPDAFNDARLRDSTAQRSSRRRSDFRCAAIRSLQYGGPNVIGRSPRREVTAPNLAKAMGQFVRWTLGLGYSTTSIITYGTVHLLSRRASPNFHVGPRLIAHNAVIRLYDTAGNVIEKLTTKRAISKSGTCPLLTSNQSRLPSVFFTISARFYSFRNLKIAAKF